MDMIKQLLWVGLGGGIGSMLRFLLSRLVDKYAALQAFPLATFIVNVSGCLLIGLLIGFSAKHALLSESLKLLLITGFCGGYTTFSTFSAENLQLLTDHHYFLFVLYALGSLATGVAAVGLGLFLAESI
jgi:CrcB protein